MRSSTWRSTVRGSDSGQTAAHWAAASGNTEALEVLLEADPYGLMLQDERQLTLSTVAANAGHGWLDNAMQAPPPLWSQPP
jgi:ankyrin repeat protein